ncbi:hypothetical protein SAMN04488514_101581 [Kriegella aquimaris]|uniref:Uncharacterized protein n=1 Tax=Kriegella aquimaris TaxID=192904 RepID=A0A1G9JJX7_9FLAO|nr:hypothetical protein SAMN04488514_101581 [Kriegella aquimaris]
MFPSVLSREALLINRALELFKASVYFLSKSFSLSPKKKKSPYYLHAISLLHIYQYWWYSDFMINIRSEIQIFRLA